jgi:hypothetical protein
MFKDASFRLKTALLSLMMMPLEWAHALHHKEFICNECDGQCDVAYTTIEHGMHTTVISPQRQQTKTGTISGEHILRAIEQGLTAEECKTLSNIPLLHSALNCTKSILCTACQMNPSVQVSQLCKD